MTSDDRMEQARAELSHGFRLCNARLLELGGTTSPELHRFDLAITGSQNLDF